MNKNTRFWSVLLSGALVMSGGAVADEGLFGYVKGAEPLPKGSWDAEQWFTWRGGKEQGSYNALDTKTEVEYGFTDRFSGSVAFFGLGINTSGLMIDAYLPGDKNYPWRPAGVEAAVKYNYLTPALDDFGLAQYTSLSYFWYDVNSGFRKNVYSFETFLIAQKYYLDGQLVVAANLGIEADSATRQPIQGLPADFEWPLTPEMEIAITASAGITYRVISNWFIGAEIFYQTEHETVVGQERWSLQAGPTIHYAARDWWVTLTWMPQLVGGGTPYPGQTYSQQLIEKTSQEVRLKIGINF
ncbi:MAG TPA: DUF6662 family protein [Burkholderiales bacterium]|nr:DUF6662 family protein [Burkholderiales bacterium]